MDTIIAEFLGKPLWMWFSFFAVVVCLLVLDLGVLNKDDHEIGVRESCVMSAGYIAIGAIFGGWVWWTLGTQSGLEYLTGFVIEKTLALDNIFVIAMIFSYFSVPRLYQHRVLFWGVLGVVVLRAIMIALGTTLVDRLEWVLDVFAIFLIATGIKMILVQDHVPDLANNALIRFMNRHFRVTEKLHGHDFFVRLPDMAGGQPVIYLTPLFLALVLIEVADVIFAVDSVPAIFAVTTDPFIVYTSNIFAILGLRALYFALSAMLDRFKYLKYAISVLLVFIGSKLFIADLLGLKKFPAMISLAITFIILGAGIGFSLWKTRSNNNAR